MVRLLWIVAGVLLALWSAVLWLGEWLLSALLGAAGELPVHAVALPDSWMRWLPVDLAESMPRALEAFKPVLQSLLDQMPVVADGITVLAWVIWAFGAGLLLLLAGASHAGLRRWQRQQLPAVPRVMLIPS